MPDQTPSVQNVTQVATLTTDGKTQFHYNVRFMVGPDGPFTIQIPQAEFTAANVKQKMEAFATEINQLPRTEG